MNYDNYYDLMKDFVMDGNIYFHNNKIIGFKKGDFSLLHADDVCFLDRAADSDGIVSEENNKDYVLIVFRDPLKPCYTITTRMKISELSDSIKDIIYQKYGWFLNK